VTQYTTKEIEMLMNMKDKLSFTWEEITGYFPDRTVGSVKVKYFNRKRELARLVDGTSPANRPLLGLKRKYSNLKSNKRNCSS